MGWILHLNFYLRSSMPILVVCLLTLKLCLLQPIWKGLAYLKSTSHVPPYLKFASRMSRELFAVLLLRREDWMTYRNSLLNQLFLSLVLTYCRSSTTLLMNLTRCMKKDTCSGTKQDCSAKVYE